MIEKGGVWRKRGDREGREGGREGAGGEWDREGREGGREGGWRGVG